MLLFSDTGQMKVNRCSRCIWVSKYNYPLLQLAQEGHRTRQNNKHTCLCFPSPIFFLYGRIFMSFLSELCDLGWQLFFCLFLWIFSCISCFRSLYTAIFPLPLLFLLWEKHYLLQKGLKSLLVKGLKIDINKFLCFCLREKFHCSELQLPEKMSDKTYPGKL